MVRRLSVGCLASGWDIQAGAVLAISLTGKPGIGTCGLEAVPAVPRPGERCCSKSASEVWPDTRGICRGGASQCCGQLEGQANEGGGDPSAGTYHSEVGQSASDGDPY